MAFGADKKKNKLNYQNLLNQLLLVVYRFFWLIIAGVVALVFFFAYQLFLMPKYNLIVTNKEILKKQQEYSDQQQYLKEIIALKDAYAKIKPEDKDKINQIINNTNDQTELFREMQYIVRKNKLVLDSLESTPLDRSFELPNLAGQAKSSSLLSSVKLVRTVCNLSGVSYEGLKKVLATMEVNLRLMDVDKVEYDPSSKKALLRFITYQF